MTTVIIFCGLPGVGKTTLARSVASLTNARILSSDKIRKELINYPTYSNFERRLVYDILILLTKYLSTAGLDCILDATFTRERSRNEVKERLRPNKVPIFVVECICPENIVIERLRNRKSDFSDADYSIYMKMKNIYEPVQGEHLEVDTSLPCGTNIQKILRYVFGTDRWYRKCTEPDP
jgi:predicted kinase